MPTKTCRTVFALTALHALLASIAGAQSLVADIGPANDLSSKAQDFTAFDDKVWFTTQLGSSYQLWSTTGDASTTQQELAFPNPLEHVTILGATEDHLYLQVRRFTAPTYRQLVKFTPGQGTSLVISLPSSQLAPLITSHFAFHRNDMGQTVAFNGTTHSAPLPLMSELLGGYEHCADFGDGRILVARDEGVFQYPDYRLVVSDGTVAGTELLPTVLNARQITLFQGVAYILATDALQTQGALWRSDGTAAGTTFVQSLGTALPDATNHIVTTVDTMFFATITESAQPGGAPTRSIWSFDGTTAQPLSLPGSPTLRIDGRCGQRALCAHLQVDASGNPTSVINTWLTDGTAIGSFAISAPGTYLTPFAELETKSVLLDNDNHDLWISDGQLNGTSLLFDGTQQAWRRTAAVLGDQIIFCWADQASDEPWVSDGTTSGTSMIANLGPLITSTSSAPNSLTAFGSSVLFSADDGSHGRELWISDGVTTTRLTDIRAGASDSLQTTGKIVATHDRAFFVAIDPGGIPRVYTTDGTVSGTESTSSPRASTEHLTLFDGRAWFPGYTSSTGWEMWSSDGTAAGTQIFANLAFSYGDSNPRPYGELGGMLIYSTRISGQQALWATDGTSAVQTLLAPAAPFTFVRAGDRAFFVQWTSTHRRLWATDGTVAGTTILQSFDVTSHDPDIEHLTAVGDRLFFRASTAATGAELWTSDGTVAGTAMLLELRAGSLDGIGDDPMVATDDVVYFNGITPTDGRELWKSDGTVAGTRRADDITPAPASTDATQFAQAGTGRHIIFSASAPSLGVELTTSDGTAIGSNVVDLQTGPGSSQPAGFVTAHERLFFAANDGVHGRELWSIDLADIGASNVKPIAPGCPGTDSLVPTSGTNSQPYVGNANFALTIDNALPNSIAVIGISDAPAPLPIPIGGDCQLHLGAADLLPFLTDAAGSQSLPIPLPATSSLQGSAFYFQYLVLDPFGAALDVGSLSDASLLLIGG